MLCLKFNQFVPRAGEPYLTPEQHNAESASYLTDEILQRVGREPIVFDWYTQIAEQGDAIADPSTAWPDTRRLVKLGTFSITGRPADPATVDRTLLSLPGQAHPGVEGADLMLVMRNIAYPISLGQRFESQTPLTPPLVVPGGRIGTLIARPLA